MASKFVRFVDLSVFILIIEIIAITLCSCDYTVYPDERPSIWTCYDPYIVLEFTQPNSYHGYHGTHTIYLEDAPRVISVSFDHGLFCVYETADIGTDRYALRGTWKYKNKKDTIVVEISEDNIFDGKYSELIFLRTDP